MTHHTDAELLPCPFCGSADVRDYESGQGYTSAFCYACESEGAPAKTWDEALQAWNRRAPAAPVPQDAEKLRQLNFLLDRLLECAEEAKEDCARAKQMMGRGPEKHCVQSALEISHSIKRRLEDVKRLLAAAPQPPEAAPVVLPEYGIDTANHAGIRVRGYTEQQVRELLAAHGIGGAA